MLGCTGSHWGLPENDVRIGLGVPLASLEVCWVPVSTWTGCGEEPAWADPAPLWGTRFSEKAPGHKPPTLGIQHMLPSQCVQTLLNLSPHPHVFKLS